MNQHKMEKKMHLTSLVPLFHLQIEHFNKEKKAVEKYILKHSISGYIIFQEIDTFLVIPIFSRLALHNIFYKKMELLGVGFVHNPQVSEGYGL